ncbi:hypothetical protein [Paenibacillus sp. RC67]|uniref:hypothetical protein n=1 Tax=Paenibacillus sp. RC67 TaxID=3039392 RepID=UPI0024AD9EDF|nr:hypothetical protein [Paenibacillus sp. RC67]
MFASVITKIYLALSGFKSNIKSLPGKPEAFEDDKVTAIRVHVDEMAALLNNISSLFESGLDEEDLKCTIQAIERLPLNHSVRLTYNVFILMSLRVYL